MRCGSDPLRAARRHEATKPRSILFRYLNIFVPSSLRSFVPRNARSLIFVATIAFTHPPLLIAAEPLALVHRQRYAMGTMFDIVVYHANAAEAARAMDAALTEVVRLDRVMSHYRPDSDLAQMVRTAPAGFVRVDPSLFEVIVHSLIVSQRTGGRFDVTIAPLLKAWKTAHAEGRRPSAEEVAAAARCVGYEKIETQPPDRVRFTSDCVDLDLGGIGKGYAVERAIAMLTSAGIRHALVNAGGSSIAAIGAPPGQRGWPVTVGRSGRRFLLVDESLSTSEQVLIGDNQFGEILDPARRAPLESRHVVGVVAASATIGDALSTSLLLLGIDEGRKLLDRFPGTSAVWLSSSGAVEAAHGDSPLTLLAAGAH